MTAASYPFIPSASSPPQFTPTFDGEQYSVSVVWGLFGQRYFIKCIDMNGNQVYYQPLLESNPGVPIQGLAWNALEMVVRGTTVDSHGYAIGATVALEVVGASPVQYSGSWLVLITGPSSFTYLGGFSDDPGPAAVPGTLSYYINMNAAYFSTPMVYVGGNFVVGQ